MRKGWTEVALGEVLDWRAPDTKVSTVQSYCFAGVYSHGKGVFKKGPVMGSAFNYDRLSQLKSDDFVYPKLMAWEGGLGLVPEECAGCFVSPEFQVFTVNQKRLVPRFLGFWFRRPSVWEELGRLSPGTNLRRRRLPASEFLRYRLPLPPLAEQQRIVAHLGAIESRLTHAQKLREEQKKELQAFLTSAFHQLEKDVTWKPMKEVAPLVWRQITIDPEESYTEYGVKSFYKGIFLRRKVPGSAFSWQELYQLKAGDIVFSNIMAWEKGIAVATPEQDGWVGNHRMLVCEPRRDVILPNYLTHYFMTADGFAKILQASPGTAARNKTLKADNLMEIEVPVPSLKRQRAFESLHDQVAQIRAAQQPQLADHSALLPSLLDRIFTP